MGGGGGPERSDGDAGQGQRRLNHRLHRAVPVIGPEEPFKQVEIGHVMIADLDRQRHIQAHQPVTSGCKLPVPRAHRHITGDDDGVGLLSGNQTGEPVKRGPILRTEMQVAGMKQTDHAARVATGARLCKD